MEAAMHAARLVVLEGALCALLRECAEGGGEMPDGVAVRAQFGFGGHIEIDVEYTRGGVGVSGESL